jgi:hypothetical protein
MLNERQNSKQTVRIVTVLLCLALGTQTTRDAMDLHDLYLPGRGKARPMDYYQQQQRVLPPIASLTFGEGGEEAPNLALMHVGKTGGTTIESTVIMAGCLSMRHTGHARKCKRRQTSRMPESAISRHTKTVFHYGMVYPPGGLEGANGVMFSVREPLARLESAYYYGSPWYCEPPDDRRCRRLKERMHKPATNETDANFKFRKFWSCFPTLESITRHLGSNASTTANSSTGPRIVHDEDSVVLDENHPVRKSVLTTESCDDMIDMVREVFHSSGLSYLLHLGAGYRYYSNFLAAAVARRKTAPPVVLVIRTEHLWHDVEKIDLMLGGDGNFSDMYSQRFTHGSELFRNRTGLPDDAGQAALVCCAMLPEIRAYQQIINEAINLSAEEKNETFGMTWKRCHVTDWETLEDKCRSIPLSIDQ